MAEPVKNAPHPAGRSGPQVDPNQQYIVTSDEPYIDKNGAQWGKGTIMSLSSSFPPEEAAKALHAGTVAEYDPAAPPPPTGPGVAPKVPGKHA